MASYDLEPVSLRGPTKTQPQLILTFRRPGPSPDQKRIANPIYPATGLQISLSSPTGLEIFLDRMSVRDIQLRDNDHGLFSLSTSPVPTFNQEMEVAVKLHSWRGEKLLGSWDVGSYTC